MQIVIDIPDDFYERVNKDGCMSYTDAEVVVNAFYRGEVLPKGHGRLIDADALEYTCNSDECGMLTGCDNCQYHIITEWELDRAQTIIEADKEARHGNH